MASAAGVTGSGSASGTPEGKALVEAVEHILGASMGVRLLGRTRHGAAAWKNITAWLVIFVLFWLTIAALFQLAAGDAGPSNPKLVGLLGWGAFYFCWAIYFSRQTTDQLYITVESHILPFASTEFAAAVALDLRNRYPPLLRDGLPVLVGLVSVIAAGWALAFDLDPDVPPHRQALTAERLLWAISYFVYFWTAGMGVISARFYLAFANNLAVDRDRLYVLGAADTPLVRGLSRLGTQVLLFWVLIFLAIISWMVLAVLPFDDYRLTQSWLLFVLVPTAGFFSLGFGTLIYLASEAKIRAVLHAFASEAAGRFQRCAATALQPARDSAPDLAAADRLAQLSDRVIAGARYGSRVGVTVSVALPLLMPIVSLVVNRIT